MMMYYYVQSILLLLFFSSSMATAAAMASVDQEHLVRGGLSMTTTTTTERLVDQVEKPESNVVVDKNNVVEDDVEVISRKERRTDAVNNDLNNIEENPMICQNDFDCRYGLCIFTTDATTSHCLCDSGFMGKYCENKCTAHCQNGGQCMVAQTDQPEFNVKAGFSIICDCPIEYAGRLCERFANETITTISPERKIKSNAGALASVVIGCIVSTVLLGYVMLRRLRHSKKIESGLFPSPVKNTTRDNTREEHTRSLQLGKEPDYREDYRTEYRTEYRTNVRGVWM
jgi:hypothetical protein